ncbi:hypothetical protein DL98DRAFT_613449 [Cadophora sp. DSE1049]|nr:hypothetical protein DL98DRAFT_613449 [Cadophora sp. DSE1049]
MISSIVARCLTTATFNLNTSGPDWDYVAKDLANTTSQICKDAYTANVDCDPTLLGLVASMPPLFDPTPADMDNTCTTTCKDSLAAYVQGVKDACAAEGDKAQESVGGGNNVDMYLDPVDIMGEIFQYQLASSCRKLSNGTYCRYTSLANAKDFDCDDSCTAQFNQVAHDYPAFNKMFNYYWLISRGNCWAEEFQTGWERLQKCGIAVGSTTAIDPSSSGSVISTSASGTATATSKESQPSITQSTNEQSGTAVSAARTSSKSTSNSTSTGPPTATVNAGRRIGTGEFVFIDILSMIIVSLVL